MFMDTRLQSQEGSYAVILKGDAAKIVHCSSCPWSGTPRVTKEGILEETASL
jgi:hypothetical protein